MAPTTPTHPGVYIEEIPSGARTIVGVSTSVTAFVGRALRGPADEPVRITSFGDFERAFGGLWVDGTLSYAVQHYFLNGGSDALVVRLHNGATRASLDLSVADDGVLTLEAANEGTWGNSLRATVDHETLDPGDEALFNLTVEEVDPATGEPRATETHRNLSARPEAARFVAKVLEHDSALVRARGEVPDTRPGVTAQPVEPGTEGSDGEALTAAQYTGSEAGKTGVFALEKADLFNLLCIPPFTRDESEDEDEVLAPMRQVLAAALAYCKKRRAMLLVDAPPNWDGVADLVGDESIDALRDENAAVFFPRVRMADPLKENRLEEFAPSGAVAGVFARTDATRGVWKAPAGLEARVNGVGELAVKLTDAEQGQLNPLGINCLRSFPIAGTVVWGSRTLEGADRLASEWKYVPVRRLALFIEESLYRGTQWVVFEPNDEALWAQIRLNVGSFMHNLFRQGAFQGRSPREAYLVKCDAETTTQNDINLGIVNVLVGFAPLKPAEFVFIRLQQLAGQVAV